MDVTVINLTKVLIIIFYFIYKTIYRHLVGKMLTSIECTKYLFSHVKTRLAKSISSMIKNNISYSCNTYRTNAIAKLISDGENCICP